LQNVTCIEYAVMRFISKSVFVMVKILEIL